MPIDIPLADIQILKTATTELLKAFGKLHTLIDTHRADIRAIRHRFAPHSLPNEPGYEHPWLCPEYPEPEDNDAMINACRDALCDIWFSDNRRAQRTYPFPGVMVVPEPVFNQVSVINATKKEFRRHLQGIKKRHRTLTESDIEAELNSPDLEKRISFDRDGVNRAGQAVKKTLEKAGIARICSKQLYRQAPQITGELLRAKYYFKPMHPSRTRTVAQQISLFRTKQSRGDHSPALASAISVLEHYPHDLVISERQEPTYVIAANCKWREFRERKSSPTQITGVLPVVALDCEDLEASVDFSSLDINIEKRKIERNPRLNRAVKWEQEPFLAGFPLHLPLDRGA